MYSGISKLTLTCDLGSLCCTAGCRRILAEFEQLVASLAGLLTEKEFAQLPRLGFAPQLIHVAFFEFEFCNILEGWRVPDCIEADICE